MTTMRGVSRSSAAVRSDVTALTEQPEWRRALEDLCQARAILLLGATDTGKTTFLSWLANELYLQGRRIAIVDTDVGQSSLGPPTTIGLGVVDRPFERPQELAPVRLYFVGSMSPRAHLLPVLVGTKYLVDHARTLAVDHVIIDTCGFVTPGGGQALKHSQIALADPDALVCFQRASECESILVAYRRCRRPRVWRFRASTASRRRSMEERQLFRQRSWQRYFASPTPLTLSWEAVNLINTPLWRGTPLPPKRYRALLPEAASAILWAEQQDGDLLVVTEGGLAADDVAMLERAAAQRVRTWIAAAFHGTLLGLLNAAGETQCLGILQFIDFSHRRLSILAPPCQGEIAGVQWSQTCLESGAALGHEFAVRT
jgi:polynucleotide 5'-hydroxyl-kinase GRC3/NOL9